MTNDDEFTEMVKAMAETYGRGLFETSREDRPAVRDAIQHRLLDHLEAIEKEGLSSSAKFLRTIGQMQMIGEVTKAIDARVAELDAEFATGPAAGNA